MPPPRKNLLLITIDTVRADHLGCYGFDRPTSPNLDSLASESVIFDHAIAQASVTPVSHASILTGLEPYHHGLRVMHGRVANALEEEQITLAEVWEQVGGEAAAFVSAFPVAPAFGLDQGFSYFDADFPQSDGEGVVTADGMVNTGTSQRRADLTTQATLGWLQARESEDRPFFLWVHYFDPHDPLVQPPREIVQQLFAGALRPASEDRPDLLRALYDVEIWYMDSQIGQLLNGFQEKGLLSETVVAVVADHGEGLGDHDWWTHGILFQEQIRVPMMIRIPGDGAPKRVGSLVRTIDLMPTLMEAAGVDPSVWPPMDGQTLLPAMATGATTQPRRAYSESVNILAYARRDEMGRRDEKDDKLYCLMDATRKLIYHQLRPEESEFYDLASDPEEAVNLAADDPPAMQELLKSLRGMDVFSPIMPGMTATDLRREERLRSLGYIQ